MLDVLLWIDSPVLHHSFVLCCVVLVAGTVTPLPIELCCGSVQASTAQCTCIGKHALLDAHGCISVT